MDVGFIGLGNMGAGIARSLLRGGHRVTVYNRTRERAEALDLARRRVAVHLPQRRDRARVRAIEDIGVRVDDIGRDADVLPVHLRHVVLGAAGSHEYRVGQAGVEVDVGEARQRDREARPDRLAQVPDVRLGRDVLALVLGLGVDQQAVGAVACGGGADARLARRVAAVHVLPGAHPQPRSVERADQRGAELRPVAGAVATLDHQRADAVPAGGRHHRSDVAAVRLRDVPDPHATAGQRVALAMGSRRKQGHRKQRGHKPSCPHEPTHASG